ncbi:hypothetical protein IU500_04245 [Nocardia terpenica]|uniref:DUF6194 family protein n=1 Tax=Nocardia terpenica TaxID=455432 RepID=UPI001894D5B8|nr:DUF6194 family protein [Nocardia terpenica]MBF6059208.1 hypothetical protein [Nocardia terpenica]MBF6103253.1 hypothetical protein [Nocardia terpenica]MBF6110558.1 hypothetical protein [Nocardia terpenica]MBF6116689.1 hypothetical protein [Nocardia terpenica]
MSIDEIIDYIEALGGVLTLRPAPGDGSPEIAWGDVFLYYAPDGTVPTTQPFATIVTKDYPDDTTSRLDRPGVFRLNINVGKDAFTTWTGHTPRETSDHPVDASQLDTVLPHPVYATAGWLAVVAPGPRTEAAITELLRTAHDRARTRYTRHAG